MNVIRNGVWIFFPLLVTACGFYEMKEANGKIFRLNKITGAIVQIPVNEKDGATNSSQQPKSNAHILSMSDSMIIDSVFRASEENPPKIDEKRNGYMFKGGNPKDSVNWQVIRSPGPWTKIK